MPRGPASHEELTFGIGGNHIGTNDYYRISAINQNDIGSRFTSVIIGVFLITMLLSVVRMRRLK
ncbi:MAG: hypothetical protein ACQEWU_01395 [Bacillota bacterium]|uniref:hypothetical protein n=1 Tax=Virgibacillus TaxID=84406 RepID=UPI0013CF2899|nr:MULTISPECIES: hypothetical protein [Virgibacillus]MCC2250764.1 hypothetical protein [Virgibacillus sp. AGTR]MDY7042844.1 hypothetical protein [Virgibacillus sp. M23]QRZ18063.1 hypothetical protein JUJ52_20485 [Virgibacillus sp. AGTR]WBX78617.1 hypothetical protein PD280_12040 [Virgibacillus salarius]